MSFLVELVAPAAFDDENPGLPEKVQRPIRGAAHEVLPIFFVCVDFPALVAPVDQIMAGHAPNRPGQVAALRRHSALPFDLQVHPYQRVRPVQAYAGDLEGAGKAGVCVGV